MIPRSHSQEKGIRNLTVSDRSEITIKKGHLFKKNFYFFLVWTILKVLIEFVTILLMFFILVFWPRGMLDLSSPTRDPTHTSCIGRRSPNHWTTTEVPEKVFCLISLLSLTK